MTPEERLELWIDRYTNKLVQLAYSYVRNWSTAEDIVQDVFIKSFRTNSPLRDESKELSWLMRMVMNESKTKLRGKRWREVLTRSIPENTSRSSEDTYMRRIESEEIYDCVLSLPDIYRTPIILYYFEDLSTKQIADVLNVDNGTVRVRIFRGRKHLKRELSKRGDWHERG
ncbi:RNA polymerase sigma factor [Alicyclobacillus sp. SO9]|uniref:RNA polymerase sigma factor n=1 Tax=Alicyclobacillus sp. SO9 TaxID=2665646 RepID=UPI0018E904E6|nr:sigma-70 family RNA polymerase sigma factor [Alicyclobacillus sp. SO9]QQE78663.1 sigma-70 family RNA polymerase sigma factor [Alicyclobacillus sp. SO9]